MATHHSTIKAFSDKMAETPASQWNESSSQGSQPPAPTQPGIIPNFSPASPQASGKHSGQCSRPPEFIPVGGSKKKNKKKKSKAKKRLRSPEPSSSNVTTPPLPRPSSLQASESGSITWAEKSKRQKVVAKKDLHTDKFFKGIAATIHKTFPVYAFAEEFGCNPAEVLDALSAVVEAPLCSPQPWHFADSVSKYGKRLIASWHDTHWPAAHVPQDQLDYYERCEREEKARLSKANFEAQQRYKERQIRAIESIVKEGTPKPIEQSVSTEAYMPPAPAFSDSDGISISSKFPAWKGKEPVRREIQSSPEEGPSVPRFRSPRQVEPSVSPEPYTPPAAIILDSDGVYIPNKDPAWKGKEPVGRASQSQPEAGPSVPQILSSHEIEVRYDVHRPGIMDSQWAEDLGVLPISDEMDDAELQQALAKGVLFQEW
ncbi:uncharacterized protein N7503_003473 [Penicillium pulvis]|uniref:uncharacterized protein n=1 Tax=Penicillium pulvis TaxID=1562058 RepID=UPI0025487473|nr:uncharacterized protein N7503_003473 [Penicillium pulvis]KAJ5805871.1 hypothetical protein N7503_003473 [Penicillium pulvis]